MSEGQLPHLETFVEAAERGSFTAAARHLQITQAAVSQRIQQLESVLDTSLFRREAGSIALTDAGRQMHEYARQILALSARAREAVTGRRGSPIQELSLAASSVPGQHLLPPLLAAFQRKHPEVQVRVSVSDTDAVLREVMGGQAQLGLVGGVVESPHLEFRQFAEDELVVVVSRKHPWAKKRQVTAEELAGASLIQREPGSASRRRLEQAMEQCGITADRLKGVLELGSSEAILEAVREGLGVAVLSKLAIRKEVQAGRLQALRLEGLPLQRNLFVVRDRRKALTPAARAFLELLPRRKSGRDA